MNELGLGVLAVTVNWGLKLHTSPNSCGLHVVVLVTIKVAVVGSGDIGVVSLTTITLFSLLLIQTNLKLLPFCLYPFLSLLATAVVARPSFPSCVSGKTTLFGTL